jgi:hypothetical protein
MGKFVISIIQGNVGLGRSELLVCGGNTYAAIVTGADRALSLSSHTRFRSTRHSRVARDRCLWNDGEYISGFPAI